MNYLNQYKVLGIRYTIKEPDDINWKKKNSNFKNDAGYDILLNLSKQNSFETIIEAIINDKKKNATDGINIKGILSGLIKAIGYTHVISMLLQIRTRLNEKKYLAIDKDNISLSSGESVKNDTKNYDVFGDTSSSESQEKNDILSSTTVGTSKVNPGLVDNLSQLAALSHVDHPRRNRGRPRKTFYR